MKNTVRKTRRFGALTICFACLIAMTLLSFFGIFGQNEGGMVALTAQAEGYSSPSIEIQSYDVAMQVQSDRKVCVQEKIKVRFLADGLTMFYRSLPKEGTRYYDISASCAGNDAFTYNVKNNPDSDHFLDINCIGNAQKGNVWTYDISYTMIGGESFGDGIIVDVIGFGWPVALHNVTATVSFPVAPLGEPKLYIGEYGAERSDADIEYSEDRKTIKISRECLFLAYNDEYGETMAEGITLECEFEKGVFVNYTSERLFTSSMPWILLGGALCIGISVVGVCLFRKKREIIPVVSVRAPDGFDPLKTGVWLDGTVDTEDVTSMIYYFAEKGYLQIDFSDEDDPELIKAQEIADCEPIYAKTLFKGLFRQGNRVRISDLSEKYYTSVQKAQMQVPKPNMYEGRSVLGFVLGGVASVLYTTLTVFLMGRRQIGNGYTYLWGVINILPVVAIWFVALMGENYRYKWKKSVRLGLFLLNIAIAAAATLVFVFGMANHIATGWEKSVIGLCGFTATLISTISLSRKEEYTKELGEILGFKEFIVYAEKERLEALLQDTPQLFYSVLPYAQVLGVSDIWEKKFRGLTVEPPTWCVGTRMTVFDYMVFDHCMRRSMVAAMQPPKNSGSHVGRSGGGGHFGSFGGGGFGGGGGGAR